MNKSVSHAAIIAGGASRRMGFPKALLQLDGEFLIARVARVLAPLFPEVIVVARDESLARATNLVAIPDVFPNKGPLGGVHAALSHFQNPTFCVACDLPFLNSEIIKFLVSEFRNCDQKCEVLMPRIHDRMETLHAIYAPSILPVLEREFKYEKVRSAERVLAAARVKFVEANELKTFDADLKFLTNLNTPEDARRAGMELSDLHNSP